jgi:hypothetical protein
VERLANCALIHFGDDFPALSFGKPSGTTGLRKLLPFISKFCANFFSVVFVDFLSRRPSGLVKQAIQYGLFGG